jgi:hypothetical protein
LLTLYNHAAFLTAIANGSIVFTFDFIKISAPYFVSGKTFRAAVVSKLFFCNAQMAVPAAQPVVFYRQQPQNFMFAVFHDSLT